jgi:hypothetical protein
MSNPIDKVKMALESARAVAKNALEGKDVSVSEEEKTRRLSICDICPSLKRFAGQMQCGECGCFLKAKAGLNDMKCPLNQW